MKIWDSSYVFNDFLKEEHIDFFKENGVILFRNFISIEKVNELLIEIKKVENYLFNQKLLKINGIPLKFCTNDDGSRTIQRIPFGSKYSQILSDFLKDDRFNELIKLLHPYNGRIGEFEKDGLVINNYINSKNSFYSKMGWHTDSPRDIFSWQKIMPMLNVGIHLDDCSFSKGGLRVIPKTHNQNLFKLLFAKKYFIDHNDDPKEIGFDIKAGDLTVHDGRLWHRVKKCPLYGEESRRRVMYIPIVTGKIKLKKDNSRTPFYHRFGNKFSKN